MNYYKLQNGNIAETGFDEFAYSNSPREYCLGTFLTWQRDYISPDENDYSDLDDFLTEFDVEYTGNKEKDLTELVNNADKKGYILFPVYFFEHTNFYYSLNDPKDPWDSGFCGVIYVEKEKIFSETSLTPKTENLLEKVKELLGGEVEEYNLWANGYVMQYSEYDLKEEDFVDSCTGFLGLDEKASGIYDEFNLNDAEYLGEFNNIDRCLNSLVSQGLVKRTTTWA